MTVWAIADLHLSTGIPNKKMDVFGIHWKNHADKIAQAWKAVIGPDDLVLIAGDISWAMKLDDAVFDLEWIDALSGTKLLLRGNHDYWWTSVSKIEKKLPPSLHLIQNNAYQGNHVSVGGARLWDTSEYRFNEYIILTKDKSSKDEKSHPVDLLEMERIYERELQRLELSLKELSQDPDHVRIVMTHYPPIGGDLKESRASRLLEKYRVNFCVFGHLHNVNRETPLFGVRNGVQYLLTAADYLDFLPLKIV